MYLKFLKTQLKTKAVTFHVFVCTTSKSSQSYGFSSSHVWMWELDYKESWVLKHRCFWTVVLEKTEISPEYSSEGLMLKPKLPILWPPDAKWLLGKDTDAREDWRPEKGITEDEMAGWHHRRTRVWASSGSWWWTGKPGLLQSTGSELGMTEQLNWTKKSHNYIKYHNVYW